MTRVALFVAGLAGAFLAALAAGHTLDVGARTVADEHSSDAGHASAGPAGLSLEQDGYRLVAERDTLTAGRAEPYVFRILAPSGQVLRDFDVEHERRLHLIVVSRALDHFLHLHPRQRPDGAWSVPLALPSSDAYRVFADFATGGERRTLGLDLRGEGDVRRAPELQPAYDIDLHEHGSELSFAVTEGGRAVGLEPYLGALGHLVVLREGDLAYVHAHADADRLAFDVPFPSAGSFRLFLQYKVAGRVETASFEVTR